MKYIIFIIVISNSWVFGTHKSHGCYNGRCLDSYEEPLTEDISLDKFQLERSTIKLDTGYRKKEFGQILTSSIKQFGLEQRRNFFHKMGDFMKNGFIKDLQFAKNMLSFGSNLNSKTSHPYKRQTVEERQRLSPQSEETSFKYNKQPKYSNNKKDKIQFEFKLFRRTRGFFDRIRRLFPGKSSNLIPSSKEPEPLDLTTLDYFNYFTKLRVGSGAVSQEFKVVFDTGSSDLWVANADTCVQPICQSRSRFEPSLSETFSPTDLTFEIPYVGNVRIQGDVGKDQFWLPQLRNPQSNSMLVDPFDNNFQLGLAGDLPESLINQTFDGILGLGLKSRLGNLPLDYIMDHQLRSLRPGKLRGFSVYLSPLSVLNDQERVTGSVVFSGVNPDHFKSPIHWFPIVNQSHWKLSLHSQISLGNDARTIMGRTALIDTGSPVIGMPFEDAKLINDALNAKPDPQSQGQTSLLPCPNHIENSNLPDLFIYFQQGSLPFRLRPTDYAIPDPHQPGYCLSVFVPITAPNQNNTNWVIGAPFLRAYSSVFDQQNYRIGFGSNH